MADQVYQEVFVQYMNDAIGGDKLRVMYENTQFNSRKLLNSYQEEFDKINL